MTTRPSEGVRVLEDRVRGLSEAERRRLALWLDAQQPPPAASLVGYYATRADAPLDSTDVRAFLADRLPAHMVPSVLVSLEALPRNEHGKLDRSALPAPAAGQVGPVAAPTDEVEVEILGLWRELLGMDRIDAGDSFFEIGGDSLLGIRLLGQIRERWQIDLPMQALFDHPTAAATAAHIKAVLWARESGTEDIDGTGERDEVEF